ncbi:relaxin receptor 1 isoform X4 [Carcharodon carcharias]|uniref:relaxin receptor 1 isoform X4 n=1 Tax=Carcharodon carcharias TaxID=13397 RepID=UPI001B7F2E18|nr:relaxin receptor 1 isoform X4 [Carcharodon carcharias]
MAPLLLPLAVLTTIVASNAIHTGLQTISCPLGYFPCGNLSVCLPQPLHCNGIIECENGADEDECADLHGWPNLADWYFYQAQRTDDESKDCLLDVYPEQCTCTGMIVDCEEAGLLTVPAVSSNVINLKLMHNNITTLVDDQFIRYRQLDMLALQNNLIHSITSKAFSGLFQLKKLFLSHNQISVLKPGLFQDLHQLEWLIVDNNLIGSITQKTFVGLKSLFFLYMMNNSLEHIPNICTILPKLNWLDVEGNNLMTIEKKSFQTCSKITVLNLSRNPMNYIHRDQFDHLIALKSLDLDGINIFNIQNRMFKNLGNLSHIYFKRFEYCRYSPHVRSCKPNTDGISSFENLLANIILRVFVWVVAFIICFGNLFVICMRSCITTENRLHTLSIKSLCCADCLMGVYLFFIGAFDMKYLGEYNKNAQQWMESMKCQLIGALAMLSTEVSVMLLTYMTLEKYMCIVFPFTHYRPGKRQTLSTLVSIWIAGFIIAVIPLWNNTTFGNYYGKNGVCFPLYSEQFESLGARGYSTGIFLGLNLLAFIIIVFSYTSMFYSIHRTGTQSAERSLFSREVAIAKRFFFIVFTDALCWIPIFLMKLLSLLEVEIPGTVTSWVVIFILPINSALNPILYTITTASFQEKLKQCLQNQELLGPKKSLTSTTQMSSV